MSGIQENVIKIAAAIITDETGKLLLVRKTGTSAFMQPGGKLENGEPADKCLQRELFEELGVNVDLESMSSVGVYSAPAANEIGFTVTAEIFFIKLDQVPVAQAEIAEIMWCNLEDNLKIELAPLTRDVVLPLLAVS